MAVLILEGEETPEAIELAMDHLRKGAQAGNLIAAKDFAVYSYRGWGSPAEADRLLLEVHAWAKRNKTERGGRERSLVLKALFEHRRARAFEPPAPPQVAEAKAELARRQALGLEPGLESRDYALRRVKADQISRKNLKRLEVAAARGSAHACGRLGCYLGQVWKEGPGADLDRAIPLVRLAAAEGSITLKLAVGTLLIRRNGPDDAAEAAYWLRYGAERYPQAANMLAFLFSEGRGVPRDEVSAIAFWHLAAGTFPEAAARAGESLVYGLHAPVDEEIGIEMLQRAFEEGNPDAADILGTCSDEGVGVPQDGAKAEMYFRAAVVKGVLTAALELGFLYFDGRRIDPNPAEAVKWLEKAGAVDSGQALHLLSVMVYRGEGTPRNVERALDLFARAQADEHLPSLFNTLEKEVLRVRPAAVRQRDFAGMIRRAEEAAAEGDADAAFLAALAHWNGEADIPRDQDKARTFFRIAAEAGHVLAKACLSEALRQNGETEEADEWLREAAEAGLPQAENRIEALKRE
ncbi:MAG: sel1 repeat family protein [Thermoanaerobaculia bacterium]|nr:sel1 repeat family protein [Thermoanaerobaculia bacterium]